MKFVQEILKLIGFNSLLNYLIKTENAKFYQFGNQFNYAGTLFYLYEKKAFSLVPQLGFAGEVYASNYSVNKSLGIRQEMLFLVDWDLNWVKIIFLLVLI